MGLEVLTLQILRGPFCLEMGAPLLAEDASVPSLPTPAMLPSHTGIRLAQVRLQREWGMISKARSQKTPWFPFDSFSNHLLRGKPFEGNRGSSIILPAMSMNSIHWKQTLPNTLAATSCKAPHWAQLSYSWIPELQKLWDDTWIYASCSCRATIF